MAYSSFHLRTCWKHLSRQANFDSFLSMIRVATECATSPPLLRFLGCLFPVVTVFRAPPQSDQVYQPLPTVFTRLPEVVNQSIRPPYSLLVLSFLRIATWSSSFHQFVHIKKTKKNPNTLLSEIATSYSQPLRATSASLSPQKQSLKDAPFNQE